MSVIGMNNGMGAPLDGERMQLRAREMAIYLKWEGERAIAWPDAEQLGKTLRILRREKAGDSAEGSWFLENGRLVESMLEKPGREKLPAEGELPRIQRLMREVVMHSDALVNVERLVGCVKAFDEIRPLEMREIWLVPAALKAEIMGLFERLAEMTVQAEKERCAGENWAAAGGREPLPDRPGGAFLERALMAARESDDGEMRSRLERELARLEIHADSAVRSEYERQALMKMYLGNAMATLRMLENLDWKEHFAGISMCERLLLQDPAGTYPRMEEESRAVVRRDLAQMAKGLELQERTVAEMALQAAQEGEKPEICYWLHENQGRQALARRLHGEKMPAARPRDPDGRRFVGMAAGLTAAIIIIMLLAGGRIWTAAAGIPVVWYWVDRLLRRILTRREDGRILKMQADVVPEAWRTLVVMPVLLADGESAEAAAREVRVLSWLSRDKNIDFLLLGDLPEAEAAETSADGGIIEKAEAGIRSANAEHDREKCFFLYRARQINGEGKYSPRERKRGALEDLNRWLLGGENTFRGRAPEGTYRFVITLDAGTRLLPQALTGMIGAMAHPLNERYAVLQPRMENIGAESPFARIMAGQGGCDTYDNWVSDDWQCMAGQAAFGGKGIYDVARFAERTAGRIRPDTVLSHDLLEGILAGCGYLGDTVLYESFPGTVGAWLNRMHRWVRGDWQLIGYFSRIRSVLGRYRMAGNWLSELRPVCLMLLALLAVWGGDGLAGGLFLAAWVPEALPLTDGRLWRHALMRIWLLPAEAWVCGDAIVRALWRTVVSHKRMLEWKTARETEKKGARVEEWPFWLAAGAMVLGAPWGLALGAAWVCAPRYLGKMELKTDTAQETDREMYLQVAADTWKYFEKAVGENGLPCDNIQLEPECPEQVRTSPTNIGLYMTSCVAVWRLGIVDEREMRDRLHRTVETLERLEKWEGQLFNWYDIQTEQPLGNRYVSSVDGGNLAACLMSAGGALEEVDPQLCRRMMRLAEGMRFETLFDARRKLFCIGMDVENGKRSEGYYDLLCSEARILYYVSAALGKTPCSSWKRLSRVCGRIETEEKNQCALLSWSGTMFEYLMPDLFLPVKEGSLLGQTRKNVIRRQIEAGKGAPFWGISESGYGVLDGENQYQYRAFGVEELALRGQEKQGQVMTPYASLLACEFAGREVSDNICAMRRAGMYGEMGFYEAMDKGRIVKSHMSHHQGMILTAIGNLLTGGGHRKDLMKWARAEALGVLLEEKPVSSRSLPERRETGGYPMDHAQPDTARRVRCMPGNGGHLLYGGGTTLFMTATGAGHCSCRGLLMNRRGYERYEGNEGFFTHMRVNGKEVLLSGDPGENSRVTLESGYVEVLTRTEEMEARLRVFVSPEDGALCKYVTLKNCSERMQQVEVTDVFSVALSPESAYNAHPAFQNLFVKSRMGNDHALIFERTPRNGEETYPLLMYTAAGGQVTEWETDLLQLTGRRGMPAQKGVLPEKLSKTLGDTLNPCAALRMEGKIPAGESWEISFTALMTEKETLEAGMEKYGRCENVARGLELAQTQSQAMLRFLQVDARSYRVLQRASGELMYPACRRLGERAPETEDMRVEQLWEMGISGELPILLCSLQTERDLERAREMVQAHSFYRAMGVWCDLILLYPEENGYYRPIRDGLLGMLQYETAYFEGPGGIRIKCAADLDEKQRRLLQCAAAMELESGEPLPSQWRKKLKPTEVHNRIRSVVRGTGETEGLAAGFTADGGYEFECSEEKPLPSPWVNICANAEFGMLITERGGGFIWSGNSRSGRVTPYANDPVKEGFSQQIYINRPDSKTGIGLYSEPGSGCGKTRVRYEPGLCRVWGECDAFSWQLDSYVPEKGKILCRDIMLTAEKDWEGELCCRAEWLMCVQPAYRRLTRTGYTREGLWARGGIGETAFAWLEDGQARSEEELVRWVRMKKGERLKVRFRIGCAPDEEEWNRLRSVCENKDKKQTVAWRNRLRSVVTPDEKMNAMLNVWLPCQTKMSRYRGRTGFYQPGGALGFRDQLQDMLPLIGVDDDVVRSHILLCAAHQFAEGDVQHWWHPKRLGVRTRISDDMLFLPYVTAKYIKETGDLQILEEEVPFLRDVEIREGQEDWYGDPGLSDETASLQVHCMRAIARACRFGEHGLALMGSGDWNDGMNRIGRMGRGESVWLTEFLLVVMGEFAPYMQEEERKRTEDVSVRLREALEKAWDGEWYLRAYGDDGRKWGSRESEGGCRIDSIAQSWAVMAGLKRGREAVMAAIDRLVDEKNGIIRLLDPPFSEDAGTGYICAYPSGVRENGGQYTHAACWLAMAAARLGEADTAWRLFEMLMPYTHAETEEEREKYRVEPYVVAGDIYGREPLTGRGGWTWYTGAAAWLQEVALREMLGYRCRGGKAQLRALLPEKWEEIGVILRRGTSEYRLLCRKKAAAVMLDGRECEEDWIELKEDGQKHTAVFPPRNPA